MGIIAQWLRKRQRKDMPQDDGGTQEQAHDTQQDMAELVGDKAIEGGIPVTLEEEGGNRSMKVLGFVGAGLFASGLIVSGLMMYFSEESTGESTQQEETEQVQSSQSYDFAADKADIEAQQAAASEAAASETEEQSASGTESAEGQNVRKENTAPPPETAASQPQSPRDRRLNGDVLVSFNSGSDSLPSAEADNSESGGRSAPFVPDVPPEEAGSGWQPNFADRLRPTATAAVSAQKRGDLTYLLAKGTNIACTLETRIVTTQPGLTRCIVSKDIYSANGKVLLIERGSKITGEQTSALLQGQARVFVLWNELETPAGIKAALASPGAGQLGEAGLGAKVDHHFWQRFGGAVMISLISDFAEGVNRRQSRNNGQQITFENSTDAAQDMATEALKNSINIPPTGYINHGSLLNIMVARDLDFSRVYERVNPYIRSTSD